jgi:hypothetical protein
MKALALKAEPALKIIDLSSGEKAEITSDAVGIANSLSPADVLAVTMDSPLRHLCQSENPSFDIEMKMAALTISQPENFFKFPLATVLDPQNANEAREDELAEFRVSFTALSEKPLVLEALQTYLRAHIRAQSTLSEVLIIADELFTNAILAAPFIDEYGVQLPIPRENSEARMNDGMHGELLVGLHEDRLVLAVRDTYGSLNMRRLIKRIHDCYVNGVEKMMNLGPGGAGIGSYMVYSAAASLYVAVHRNKTTIVACCVPIKMSSRKRQELPKNIHLIGLR